MIYHLNNAHLFFKDTKGTSRKYFIIPSNLFQRPPYSYIKRPGDAFLLIRILNILCDINTDINRVVDMTLSLREHDIVVSQWCSRGAPVVTQSSRLVKMGILQAFETIEEYEEFLQSSKLHPSHNSKRIIIENKIRHKEKTPLFNNSEIQDPIYSLVKKHYPSQKVSPDEKLPVYLIGESDVPDFEKALKNYAEICKTEKTADKFIINPVNFIRHRWREFVNLTPKKIKSEHELLSDMLASEGKLLC